MFRIGFEVVPCSDHKQQCKSLLGAKFNSAVYIISNTSGKGRSMHGNRIVSFAMSMPSQRRCIVQSRETLKTSKPESDSFQSLQISGPCRLTGEGSRAQHHAIRVALQFSALPMSEPYREGFNYCGSDSHCSSTYISKDQLGYIVPTKGILADNTIHYCTIKSCPCQPIDIW